MRGTGLGDRILVSQEVIRMWELWLILAGLIAFFVWAGLKTRGRDNSTGPEGRGDLQRRVGGHGGGNG